MEKAQSKSKKEKSSLVKTLISGVAGATAGGVMGFIDGIGNVELGSSQITPLIVGGGLAAISKKSKFLGKYQALADGTAGFFGYQIGYPITRAIAEYIKK